MQLTFDFGHVNVLLLLVAQQRMEERVDQIRVRYLVRRIEQRHQELADFGQPSFGNGFDVGTADVNAAGKTI